MFFNATSLFPITLYSDLFRSFMLVLDKRFLEYAIYKF